MSDRPLARVAGRGAATYLGPLPSWGQSLAARLAREGFLDSEPDLLAVEEYLPGQGERHLDRTLSAATACSISLGSACLMDFAKRASDRTTSLLLERGSLLVLRDEARYEWKHSIARRSTDTVNGNTLRRKRRVSLTFQASSLGPGSA